MPARPHPRSRHAVGDAEMRVMTSSEYDLFRIRHHAELLEDLEDDPLRRVTVAVSACTVQCKDYTPTAYRALVSLLSSVMVVACTVKAYIVIACVVTNYKGTVYAALTHNAFAETVMASCSYCLRRYDQYSSGHVYREGLYKCSQNQYNICLYSHEPIYLVSAARCGCRACLKRVAP